MLSQQKSAERRAFEHYLRTGEQLTAAEWERKFNPYHDELGRFTFAPGAARMANRPKEPPLPPTLAGTPLGRGHPPARQSAATKPRRIAQIPGYPETGTTAWRSSNDAVFAAAADLYNKKYGLKPDQDGYRTPEFLKAWAMRETGEKATSASFVAIRSK